MWEKIINLAISNGIWAVLFVLLLLYILKDSRTREVKYQTTIKNLGDNLNVVNIIHEKVDDIGQDLENVKTDMAVVKSNVTTLTNNKKINKNTLAGLSEKKEIA